MLGAKNEKSLERREAQLQATEPYAKSPMARCRSHTAVTLVSPSATFLPTFRAGDDASSKAPIFVFRWLHTERLC
jgi:hypothetical protein